MLGFAFRDQLRHVDPVGTCDIAAMAAEAIFHPACIARDALTAEPLHVGPEGFRTGEGGINLRGRASGVAVGALYAIVEFQSIVPHTALLVASPVVPPDVLSGSRWRCDAAARIAPPDCH